jgi:CDP-diacylglycerol--serine O-phosphatidyltransferase
MSVKSSVKSFDWHKLMFVLPNLFTVSSIFCGFYSMVLATEEKWIGASISIFFSNFFDTFDGRVARLTKTQSEFGTEMDSLADVISFGVAPAFVVYLWMLKELGTPGVVISFLFAMCGALRLARFNVLAHRHVPGSSRFFVGLPIPLGAGTIIALILADETHTGGIVRGRPWLVSAIVLVLAILMVSNIRYRTFKEMKFTRKTICILCGILLVGIILALVVLHPAVVLLLYFLAYLAMGIVEGMIGLVRHQPVGAAAAVAEGVTVQGAAAASPAPAADSSDEDEEVEDEDEEDSVSEDDEESSEKPAT